MLKEKFRNFIIQEKIGLITKPELIQLADSYILENDEFPYWLQKISMCESLFNEDLLDLKLNPINDIDCMYVAEILLNSYKNRQLTMHQIDNISRKLCNLVDSRSDSYYHFDWITDEVYLIEEGHKSKKDFKNGLVDTLNNLIDKNKKSV